MERTIGALRFLFSIDRQLQAEASEDLTAEDLEQRARVRREISGSLLTSYDALMRARRWPPVVAVRGSHCSGCNLRLTPQLANQVGRGERLLECPHCSRLLFRDTRRPAFAAGRARAGRNRAQLAAASRSGRSH